MTINNAMNYETERYFWCYKLSASQLDVTGDSTEFKVPYDTIVSDKWGLCSAGSVTLPVTGLYVFGISWNATNYSTITSWPWYIKNGSGTTIYSLTTMTGSAGFITASNGFIANATQSVKTIAPTAGIYPWYAGAVLSVSVKAQCTGLTKTIGLDASTNNQILFWGYPYQIFPALTI